MCNRRTVISGIQSHIFREMTKALLNLPENGWQRRSVIDVRWFYMYIDNHIVLTVYRAMLTVMKSIRFPVAILLSAFWICQAFHLRFSAASCWRMVIIIMLKWLFTQYLSVQINLLIQFFHVFFRCFFYRYQYLSMLICFCFDMRGVGIQNISSNQLLVNALLQDVVKDLFRNVVVAKATYTV